MKKILAALSLMGAIVLGGPVARASDVVLPSSSIVNGVLVPAKNVDIDLNQYHADSLSVQVVYSSASPTTVTFGDGSTSNATITVVSLTGLTTAYATNSINFTTNSATAVSGSYVSINGTLLREGVQWNRGASAHATAVSLCTYLNKAYGTLFLSTVTATGSVIASTAVVAGTAANAYTCATSTPTTITCNAAFTGGQDNATLSINNSTLQFNRDFYTGGTATLTAKNLAAAINASSSLSQVLTSTNTGAVVYATSTIVGKRANFTLVSSTPAALSVSGGNFTGGTNADITLSASQSLLGGLFNYSLIFPGSLYGPTNTINETPTGFGTGTELLYTKTAGTVPTGLTNNTTYFVSNLTSTSFQLADTSTGAVAGIALPITTTASTGGGTFKLTPLAISGTPTFKLQKSNDDVNFQDVYVSTSALLAPFAASVSFASPYSASNQMWELGDVNYRWLRLVYTAATHGGTQLQYIINGKRK